MEIRWNARGLGGPIAEEEKLILVEMHLSGTVIRQYDALVQKDGLFQTYVALTDWLYSALRTIVCNIVIVNSIRMSLSSKITFDSRRLLAR